VKKNKIIFGPINSRRFGMSLGVDLSPSIKQCNFDCLYCELAPMQTVSMQSSVVEITDIVLELQEHLDTKIDVITFTANGEPTLYPHLEELIREVNLIKGDIKTLILTNSATLVDQNVFDTLLQLDQVKLSLDAVSPDVFKKIDRPHNSIKIEEVVQKVIHFSQTYKGKLFIEVLFVRTINDTKEELELLNNVLTQLQAYRIDLGTIDRPPAYPVEGISYGELFEISLKLDSSLPIHIASRVHAEPNNKYYSKEEIMNTLDKRPLTKEDIDLLFDDVTMKEFTSLLDDGEIVIKTVGNLEFYLPSKNEERKLKK